MAIAKVGLHCIVNLSQDFFNEKVDTEHLTWHLANLLKQDLVYLSHTLQDSLFGFLQPERYFLLFIVSLDTYKQNVPKLPRRSLVPLK